jgi:hypothetical protein
VIGLQERKKERNKEKRKKEYRKEMGNGIGNAFCSTREDCTYGSRFFIIMNWIITNRDPIKITTSTVTVT